MTRPLLLGMGWFPDQPGGLNRHFRDLAASLAQGGSSPRAIVVGPAAEAPAGVEACAPASLARRLVGYTLAARRGAAGAEVVDAHFALYALLPVLGPLRRLPLVVHFHGPWADESRASGRGSRFAIAAKRRVERTVYRRAEELVVLSRAFGRILVERYGVEPWRVNVVAPGVDLERFSPRSRRCARAALRLPKDGAIALAVRRLVPRMGLDTLVGAWATIAAHDPTALLLLAGAGPSREALEAQASRLGLAGRIRFLGRVDEADLPTLYAAADLCVVPTHELEGFGLTVLESLACATPVVATAVSGLPEVLGPLDPSLVVPPGDGAALASRIERALAGEVPSPARCRSHAERYSWTEAAAKTKAVYARAVAPGARKLRVVYLDHCARLSGAELALLRLLPALEDVEPHVILAEEGPLADRLSRAGVSIEVLPLAESARDLRRDRVRPGRLPAAGTFHSALYVARLAARLRRLKPDLVHTNSLKAGLYGVLAARAAGVPAVWHLRDRISSDHLPRPAVRLVQAVIGAFPDAVIANSRSTLAELDRPPRLSFVIPSPTAVGAGFDRAGSDAGITRLGMVGRIAPWKGQHVFLRAFARAFPAGAERAVVVGAPLFGEAAYEAELHRLAANLALEERVEFTGFREDVAAELARLDVLVHASVLTEPFGQAVVEGLAAGVPVVAADAGGPAELIDDGVTGLLYPAGDVDALAERLRRLSQDPGLRSRLSDAGRVRARDFAPRAVADRVTACYRQVLAA